MAWTNLDQLNVNEEITTSYLNALARNIEYLRGGKKWVLKQHPGTGGNYIYTNKTTINLDYSTPVDSSTFKITDTFQGPVVLLIWHAVYTQSNTSNNVVLGFQVDNNSIGESHANLNTYVATYRTLLIVKPIIISSGEHSFDIYWGLTGLGTDTATIHVAYKPFFAALEL